MRRLVAILMAALFSAVTVSAYAIDQGTQGNPPPPQKHAKKKTKKSQPSGVQQGAPAAQGRATPSGAPAGGSVQQGAPAAQGRGSATGAPAAGGGAVASPTPKGAGRADNQ